MRANSLWLAGLLLIAAPVAAETYVSGHANVRAGPSELSDGSSDLSSTSAYVFNRYTWPAGSAFEGISPSGAATGSGTVDYGFAKLGVSGNATDAGSQATASMAASFADRFSILGRSQYAGQTGTLTINIAFDYRGEGSQTEGAGTVVDIQQQLRVLSAAGSVDVEQRLMAQSGGGSSINQRSVVLRTPTESEQLDLPFATEYSVIVPFLFDQPVSISNLFVVQGSASGSNVDQEARSASFFIDAFNSYYWGGMEVRDSTGALVFTELVSDSGTDWRQSFVPTTPVPEPATAAMVVVGVLVLAWRTRRKLTVPSTALRL